MQVPSSQVVAQAAQSQVSFWRELLLQHDATIVAHYYVDAAIQALAEETGGCVADSLAMAKFGQAHKASTLLVAGVRFMGETAKILSPEKRVLMSTLEATCSLDEGCPAEDLVQLKAQHPERLLVVYANTSAAVKALADWVVTSSNAIEIVTHLHQQGHQLIWAPDRYLGRYVQQQTGADMVIYQGACIVHEEFKAQGLKQLKQQYPDAAVLVHPESPESVCALADVIGSTSRLLHAVSTMPNQQFIVATDRGIVYKMQQNAPSKQFMIAPTAGEGATCQSCAQCPWMAMNQLDTMHDALVSGQGEVVLDAVLATQARKSLQRMVEFG